MTVIESGTDGRRGVRQLIRRNKLKFALISSDSIAIFTGFIIATLMSTYSDRNGWKLAVATSFVAVAAGLWAIRSQGLFLARVSAVRVVEITRTARAMAILAALMLLFDRVTKVSLFIRYTALGCTIAFVLICIGRSAFRSWLTHARERGQFRRAVVVIGTDAEAVRLIDLFNTHRDIGIVVTGVIGDAAEADRHGLRDYWLGGIERAETLVDFVDASGVVVSPTGLPTGRLNELIRNLHADGRHVHVATGISGIDARRLRAVPLAHEPLFYVEAPSLAKMQLVAKRCFDVVVASVAIVVLSPVVMAVALAIKLDDGGPILFSQKRIGRDGRTFGVFKFRSMSTDAEARLAELQVANERNGPLFKMERDPRVTRIGHFLRESSLDELPQLLNVLKGEMSLVGPRPALPSEVVNFPPGLRMREQVMPGITGLWQVEARDNPSFEAYRRLDLFYVENWSITLDLLIIVGTMEQIVSRVIRTLLPSGKTEAVVAPALADGTPLDDVA